MIIFFEIGEIDGSVSPKIEKVAQVLNYMGPDTDLLSFNGLTLGKADQ